MMLFPYPILHHNMGTNLSLVHGEGRGVVSSSVLSFQVRDSHYSAVQAPALLLQAGGWLC